MGVSMSEQAMVFLGMAICGVIIGVVFDVFRIFRKFVKLSTVGVNISDFIFWLITTFIVFFGLFYFNEAELRWYEFLGLFLGGILYFLTVSVWIIWCVTKIIAIFCKIIMFILKIVLTPLTFLYKILISPLFDFLHNISIKFINFCNTLIKGVKNDMKAHKKPKPKNKKKYLFRVLFILLLATMFIRGIIEQPKITENKAKISELQNQIKYEENRIQQVDALKDKVDTDEYIEQIARDKLGLVKENEKIFVDVSGQ